MALFDLHLPELERYLPELDEPADFDDFWASTLDEARTFDLGLTVTPVDTGLTAIDAFDVTFAGFGGHPIKAWVTRPAGVAGELPAVVELIGYGGGRGFAHERLAWAAAGYVHLVMDTRGQGSTWGNGGHTPDPAGSGPASPGVMTRGIRDPHEHYYRRLITDGVRAVDAVRALPGVDRPDRVGDQPPVVVLVRVVHPARHHARRRGTGAGRVGGVPSGAPGGALPPRVHHQVRVPGGGPGEPLVREPAPTAVADELDDRGQVLSRARRLRQPRLDRVPSEAGERHVEGVDDRQPGVDRRDGQAEVERPGVGVLTRHDLLGFLAR